MCLITKQKEPKITGRTRTVYKVGRKKLSGFTSHNMYFEYTYGKLYKTKLKADHNFKSYADQIISVAYNIYGANAVDIRTLTHVHQGFHFYKTLKRIKQTYTLTQLSNQIDIVKCVIPKGSEVYFDKTGLGVSNQIIVTNKPIKQ